MKNTITKNKKILWIIGILLSIILIVTIAPQISAANDQDYPSHDITVIVPWSPGGGSDVTNRALSAVARDYLGVSLIVVNRPGGTGSIGTAEAAKADPDGYTLSWIGHSNSTATPLFMDVPYHPIDDFEFVIRIYNLNNALGVNTKLAEERGWNTIEDFVQYCKDNPGQVRIGHSGVGGLGYLGVYQFAHAFDLEVVDVPYQGTGPTAIDTAGGHIDAMIGSATSQAPFIANGDITLLASARSERDKHFPDVPTFKELGYDVIVNDMGGYGVPPGTPPERIQFLHDAFKEMLDDPSFIRMNKSLKIPIAYLNSADFKKAVEEEYNRNKRTAEMILNR